MKTVKTFAALLLPLLLCGCLEVDQHPPWMNGKYAGKADNKQYQVKFHNDKLAWTGAVLDRNNFQNEYNRANP